MALILECCYILLRPWWFLLLGSGKLALPSTYKALWRLRHHWRNAKTLLRHEVIVTTPPDTDIPLIITYVRVGRSVTSKATPAALRQPAVLDEHARALRQIGSPLDELASVLQSLGALSALPAGGAVYSYDINLFANHLTRDWLVLLAVTLLFDGTRRITRLIIRRKLQRL